MKPTTPKPITHRTSTPAVEIKKNFLRKTLAPMKKSLPKTLEPMKTKAPLNRELQKMMPLGEKVKQMPPMKKKLPPMKHPKGKVMPEKAKPIWEREYYKPGDFKRGYTKYA